VSREPEALDFYGLLRTLLEHDAEFVLIGGFALGFHGVPRGTKDVDIVPDPSTANITRLWDALESLEAAPVEHADRAFERGNSAYDTRLGRLDLMPDVIGVESYEELRANAVKAELRELGRPIWIAGRDDLVTMKQEAGRPQDLIDVQALRMAEGLEE